MATIKLHQVIAVEKGVKQRVTRGVTDIYHAFQHSSNFEGHTRTYAKVEENGEDLPDERQVVKMRVGDSLNSVAEQLTELMDVVITKDSANCEAKADVEVDGKVLMKDVPVTTLIFLEKQLTDFHTVAEKLPVLDPALDWHKDDASGLFKSDKVFTTKKAKVATPIVLYPATPEHPAQTHLLTEDKTVGTWTMVKHSGAVTNDYKTELLRRVRALLKAVKYAREAANSVEAPEKKLGDAVFGFLLRP